ncbi:MAG: hypothetical protein ACRDOI_40900 [Trebonia sp.]
MRYQRDLQAALRTRHKRLNGANAWQIHDEIRLVVSWVGTQPALQAILAEAEQTEPGLDFLRWENRLRNAHQQLTWPCHTEAGRASLAWRLLERIARLPPGSPSSQFRQQQGPVLEHARALSAAPDGNIHILTRQFTEHIVSPLFDFLLEQVAAEGSLLYILGRHVRRVEWFDRDDLYTRAMQDTRKTEEVYDTDLRRFLFSEGINMPFSQARSASGLSDVLADLDTEDPLVCEMKIFDAASRSKRHLASGANQVLQYATDYGKQAGYLVITNLSGRPLNLPSEESPKTWPPRVTVAGVCIYLIAVRALPTLPASKQGKPAPVTISYDDLIDLDAIDEGS